MSRIHAGLLSPRGTLGYILKPHHELLGLAVGVKCVVQIEVLAHDTCKQVLEEAFAL